MSEQDNSTVGAATPEEVREFLEASARMSAKDKEQAEAKETTYDLKEILEKNKPKEQEFQVLEGIEPQEMAAALGMDLPEGVYVKEDDEIPEGNNGAEEVKKKVTQETRSHKNQRKWAKSLAELGDVEVTDLEKRLFLKSVLHDENVTWTIALEGMPEAAVTCRSLFEWELSLIFSALADDAREGLVRNDEEYFANLQNYSVCMQVEKIGDAGYKHKFYTGEDGNLLEEATRLRKHMYKHIRAMSSTQKMLVFTALRLFHAKYDICQGKMRDKNFWTPRD